MMPLRAAIPSSARNPTSDPSEMPPPANAARTPPTRAAGSVRKTSVARRQLPKDACKRRKIPMAAALAKLGQVVADFRHAPHDHLKHLLLLEQAPDLNAGKNGGHLPADVAGLEAVAFGRGQVYPDLHLGFLGLALHV